MSYERTTKIEGTCAAHSIITDECRRNRKDEGAWTEAVTRLRREYDRIAANWGTGMGVKIHLALTVERPIKPEEKDPGLG